MTIPMPKKEYISIQMTPEHRNRYNILTDALLERQQLYPKPIICRIVDFARNNTKRDGK